MIVVKVGGSLFDLPDLRERLQRVLEPLNDEVHVIPGGGPAAEAVRKWDRIHSLGEETSHWLAVRAMSLSARFLQSLVDPRVKVIDVEPWLRHHDTIPRSWAVTSDSIAAHYATVMKAKRLILLKSTDGSTPDAVDDYFPVLAAVMTCELTVINLRDSNSSASKTL